MVFNRRGIYPSMKTILATLVVAAAVAPVAAYAAAPSTDATRSAQADCTALKAKMGLTSFSQAYSSFGACVSSYASVEQANITSAQATCTAQQADTNFASEAGHNGKTFDQFYGNGKKGNNAFNNCVSSLVNQSSNTERQGRMNPSRTCNSSRTQMGASTFTSLYKTFGKCVSVTAHAQSQNEQSASASCQAAQTKDATTFGQTYASFGACVSAQSKAASTTQQQATVHAAKLCASQLKASATTFKSTYHTFGACVSKLTHQ
jgi:hypothetical protein